MLKYVTKFAMDILPSVIATIIGAYIVNHYIVTKPDPPATAAISPAEPKKAEPKPSGAAGAAGNLPRPGVTAKGISEKAMLEHTAAEKPSVVEKSAEPSADKPAETASIPADTRRHPAAPREKLATKPVVVPPAAAAAPVVAAPATATAAETQPPSEETRDANELARAAIERLRGGGEAAPRPQEAARTPDAPTPRVVSVAPPGVSAPAVRPLPPPILVAAPSAQGFDQTTGSVPARPANPVASVDDPSRPTPPADIPGVAPSLRSLSSSGPLDLRAEAVEPQQRQRTNVAEDMLLAAKSVFHAVLPK